MKPSKGRIVFMRNVAGDELAAIVVEVREREVVDLFVFPTVGDPGGLVPTVAHWEPVDGQEPTGSTWHWPPRV